jgi:hypothetical protein
MVCETTLFRMFRMGPASGTAKPQQQQSFAGMFRFVPLCEAKTAKRDARPWTCDAGHKPLHPSPSPSPSFLLLLKRNKWNK